MAGYNIAYEYPNSSGSLVNAATSALASYQGQSADAVTPVETASNVVTDETNQLQNLINQYTQQMDAANAAVEQRYQQGLDIWDTIGGMYGEGGSLYNAAMSNYTNQKRRYMASQTQNLVNAGMANTTVGAGLDTAYEQEVGAPFQLSLADSMVQRQSEALQGKANWIQAREDAGPSPELLANLVQTASSQPEDSTSDTTDVWNSGQSGAITEDQWDAEVQRQALLKQNTSQQTVLQKQIEAKQNVLNNLSEDDARRSNVQKVIDTLTGRLDTATSNIEKYADINAAISSVQFAEEQQRRQGLQQQIADRQAQAAAAEQAAHAGQKYVRGIGWMSEGSYYARQAAGRL